MPLDRWMTKQYVVYTCNVSFSCEKEWSSDVCSNMNEPENLMLGINQTYKDKY